MRQDQQAATLVEAHDLFLSYDATVALAGASVDVREGEILVLTGKSGSGKSSLLYCLAAVVRPNRGRLDYRGRSMTDMSDDEASTLRRSEFGFVFQFGELVPELSIRENVSLPLRLNGWDNKSSGRVTELLRALGIEDVERKRPSQVSGGQAQRAAIARALVHRPRVVFADEPTGALDTENSQIVLTEFVRMARDHHAAIVLVTHEPGVAAVGDRHLVVTDGRVTSPSREQ
ncbi:MAG: ABC transporter ATP-binding protein [Actinomycetota bacterium]|nr:ABC transporter ATP-binding protein [Actinomycetota bacterium]